MASLVGRAVPTLARARQSSCSRRAVVAQWKVTKSLTGGRDDIPITIGGLTLLTAKQDLLEHCTMRPGDKECTPTLDWFTKKCEDVQAALSEGGPGSSANEEYLHLLQTLCELAGTGSMDQLYASLKRMKWLEERRAEGGTPRTAALTKATVNDTQVEPTADSLPARNGLSPEARKYFTKVFERADQNANGHLSWSEFNSALHWLGDDMTEDEMELVSSALDLHGSVTLDEFLAIVESAEAERSSPGADARFLRHLMHQHPSHLDHLSSTSSATGL